MLIKDPHRKRGNGWFQHIRLNLAEDQKPKQFHLDGFALAIGSMAVAVILVMCLILMISSVKIEPTLKGWLDFMRG